MKRYGICRGKLDLLTTSHLFKNDHRICLIITYLNWSILIGQGWSTPSVYPQTLNNAKNGFKWFIPKPVKEYTLNNLY